MKRKAFLSSTLVIFSTFSVVNGAVITAVGTGTSTQEWHKAESWSNNAAATSGNDYEIGTSDGTGGSFGVRSPDGTGSATFAGNSLTVYSNGSLIFKVGNGGATRTINDLRLAGGTLSNLGNAGAATIAGNMLAVTSTVSTFITSGTSGRDFIISANVSGDGTLRISGGQDRLVKFTNASSTYAGLFDVTAGRLQFAYALDSGASLSLSGSGTLVLDQDLTFSSLSLGGANIAANTYTMSDLVNLNAGYANYFASGSTGTNTITVIPEPSTFALALLSLGLIRRRRA